MLSKVVRLSSLLGLLCLPATVAPQYRIPDNMVILMQRGRCEVKECPVYRILIFANGDIIWHGQGWVAKRGVILSQIEPEQIRALIQDFESIDYFHLENSYGFHGSGCRSSLPYMPMVITSLSMGELSKTLSHHDGCVGEVSEKLTALENSIDKAVDAARWITGKPSVKKRQ